MKITTKVTQEANRPDHYKVKIETYKNKIEGTFERSELRYMIEQLDNAINVGLDSPKPEQEE